MRHLFYARQACHSDALLATASLSLLYQVEEAKRIEEKRREAMTRGKDKKLPDTT